ncbi:hypothetical protein EYR36_011868 [Pleurotus pulmonarius]|nr:hypothetical protein EYR36_011868 [Pleurotus pulmonarius]KAF4607248.1 hypothetical protein EYR38_001309 [Pleurotus pulmonarius]
MSRPHIPLASPDTSGTAKRQADVLDPEGFATDGNPPRKRPKKGTSISTTVKLNARDDIHAVLVLRNPSLSKERDVCVVSGMTDEIDDIEYSHIVARTTQPPTFYEGKTKFSYHLAATPEMSNRHISTYDPSLKPTDPAAFERHFYPFDTLPKFELNVHPHFVIFNTGFRLQQIFGSGAVLHPDMLENYFKLPNSFLSLSLKSCYDLYRIWMSASPPEAFLHSGDCHWDDQDAARKPAGTSSSGSSQAGALRAGRNSEDTNTGPLGGSGSSTVDRDTMPLGTDGPDDFIDTELVMPDDSISLLLGEDDEAQSHQVREEEEEDHEAFFRGVKRWAEDVYETTEDASDDGDNSSGSDTFSYNKTLVDNTPHKYGELEDVTMADASLKTGLIHQPLIFHSFWDTY